METGFDNGNVLRSVTAGELSAILSPDYNDQSSDEPYLNFVRNTDNPSYLLRLYSYGNKRESGHRDKLAAALNKGIIILGYSQKHGSNITEDLLNSNDYFFDLIETTAEAMKLVGTASVSNFRREQRLNKALQLFKDVGIYPTQDAWDTVLSQRSLPFTDEEMNTADNI